MPNSPGRALVLLCGRRGRQFALAFQSLINPVPDVFNIKGFGNVIPGIPAHGIACGFKRGESGNHDEDGLGREFAHTVQQLDTVHPRHFDVCYHDIKFLGLAAFQRSLSVRGALHLKSFAFKINGQHIADAALIIYNENFCCLSHLFPCLDTNVQTSTTCSGKGQPVRELSTLKAAAVSVFQRVG